MEFSELNKYAVVEFPDEETVEVVSTNWIKEDKRFCYWPNAIGSRLKRLIILHSDPTDESDKSVIWKVFKCRVFNAYDNYDLACKKRDKAQFTSNLESAAEETPKTLRQSKKPARKTNRPLNRLRSSSESSEQGSPSKKTDLPFSFHRRDPSNGQASSYEPSLATVASVERTHPNHDNQGSLNLPPPRSNNQADLAESIASLGRQFEEEWKISRRFQEVVITRLVNLDKDFKELLAIHKRNGGTYESSQNVNCYLIIKIPVASLEEFTVLQTGLATDHNKNSLVYRLSLLGGKTPREITNRILDHLLCKSVSQKV